MAPSRPRGLDDSRSESSTIAQSKSRSHPGFVASSQAFKSKRAPSHGHTLINGYASALKAPPNTFNVLDEADNDQPRVKIPWHAFSTATLHTYRYANRLSAPSAYLNPHADLILTSSRTGLRSPSSVFARRKTREAKGHTRQKAGPQEGLWKVKDRERSSDRLKEILTSNSTPAVPDASLALVEGKQTHNQLATAVRRHFNSQQVNQRDVMAKFAYVVRRTKYNLSTSMTVGTKGSKVLNISPTEPEAGWEIGSGGREEDRKKDLGFRLRFRP